jgi:hypothetical protein
MRSLPVRGAICGLALAVATPAAAQDPVEVAPVPAAAPAATPEPVPTNMSSGPAAAGPDTVLLRDGATIRGTIAEVFPGKQVTIVSAAGQRYTFEWAQVADVRYAGAQADPVQGPGRPRLHIEATRPGVRLYEVGGTMLVTQSWGSASYAQAMQSRAICTAPCDRVVDGTPGQSFYFGGDRIPPSRRFTLLDHDGDVTAVVKPGRVGMLIGGILATSFSLAPLMSGAVFAAMPRSSSSRTDLHRTGGILLGVGAGLLVSGVLMIAFGRTRVALYRRYTGAAQRRGRAM